MVARRERVVSASVRSLHETALASALRFFFVQAEDGIRDATVTGVQTCALPISCPATGTARSEPKASTPPAPASPPWPQRSEERRVGKSVDLGGRRIIKKKK